jgi:hypothetical protein
MQSRILLLSVDFVRFLLFTFYFLLNKFLLLPFQACNFKINDLNYPLSNESLPQM